MVDARRRIVSCCPLASFALPPVAKAQVGPLGSELQVNTYTPGSQDDVAVASDAGAIGNGCANCDATVIKNGLDALGLTLDVDGNGSKEPLTDGLLVLRYLFGFNGNNLITGAVGNGCSRCDAPAISGYLAGLDG